MDINIFGLRVFIEFSFKTTMALSVLIAIIVISYIYMINMRKKRIIKFGNFETLKKVEGMKRFSISPVLLLIKVIIVVMIFLVATNSIGLNIQKPIANTDFIIAIDSSPSMQTPDYEPNRMEVAKELAKKSLSKLPMNTKIGVISFSGSAISLVDPTTNFLNVNSAIDSVTMTNEIGNYLGDVLIVGDAMLKGSEKNKAIVIITDGSDAFGGVNISDAVEYIREDKVNVYIVGIGNSKKTMEIYGNISGNLKESKRQDRGSRIIKTSTLGEPPVFNEKVLKDVAGLTGGKYYYIESKEELDEAFNNVFLENERVPLDSSYYVLIFIAFLAIMELLLYSKYGAI